MNTELQPLDADGMKQTEDGYTEKDAVMSKNEARLLHDADKAATRLQLSGLKDGFTMSDVVRLLIKGFIHYRAKASREQRDA